MPRISLVVCLFQERDFLQRLLRETGGLFDDLVVVHDGPENEKASPGEAPAIDYGHRSQDEELPNEYTQPSLPPHTGSIHELVVANGGRYFEGPRCYQQEPHWPFAWWQARHDWILRLDADEFPSDDLRRWLQNFRNLSEEPAISGYLCIWPMWDGQRTVTRAWPATRNFLFHRRRVRFFGMVEQVPLPDNKWQALPLTLCHQPHRKSYGLHNVLIRPQGRQWRRVIAESLLGQPSDLPRWRWGDETWPYFWQRLRAQPVRAGAYFLARNFVGATIHLWQTERRIRPAMALATPLHHFLLALKLRRLRQKQDDA
ncbi:MAG TPA: hypothetical protein VGF73_06515 [Chthoniobacterales bacterium]